MLTGTDCSGLVSLSYRANGILLPRNSGDIFKISTNITDGAQSLLEGDCLFFSDGDQPYNIIHVMMVAEVVCVYTCMDICACCVCMYLRVNA